MTLLALTVNKGHIIFDDKIEMVAHSLLSEKQLMIEYLEIVGHNSENVGLHYHVLLISQNKMLYQELERDKSKFGRLFHFELIGNVERYQKYINNHDLVSKFVWGDMPYTEKADGDKLAIDVANGWSMKQLLLRHGYKALRSAFYIKVAREMLD